MIDFRRTEIDILYSRSGDRAFIDDVVSKLNSYKEQIDYNCHRFIDQYGPRLDSEKPSKYLKFMKIQNEEYSKITRLMRVINAYTKN